MMHKILVEPEKLAIIKKGDLKHYLIHNSFNVAKGDILFFHTAGPDKQFVDARATYIDRDLPGCNNNHFIFSFELI